MSCLNEVKYNENSEYDKACFIFYSERKQFRRYGRQLIARNTDEVVRRLGSGRVVNR